MSYKWNRFREKSDYDQYIYGCHRSTGCRLDYTDCMIMVGYTGRKGYERGSIGQDQTVASRLGWLSMRSGAPRDGRSAHRVPSHVQRNRSRRPSPSPVGAASRVHISGLAGRSYPVCGAPRCINTSRVTGTALDPIGISRPGGNHGSKRAGVHRGFVVLGPDCTRSILIPVLACRSGSVVRDSLAGTTLRITRRTQLAHGVDEV